MVPKFTKKTYHERVKASFANLRASQYASTSVSAVVLEDFFPRLSCLHQQTTALLDLWHDIMVFVNLGTIDIIKYLRITNKRRGSNSGAFFGRGGGLKIYMHVLNVKHNGHSLHLQFRRHGCICLNALCSSSPANELVC